MMRDNQGKFVKGDIRERLQFSNEEKDNIIKLYLQEKKSIKKISKIVHHRMLLVSEFLKEEGIKIRDNPKFEIGNVPWNVGIKYSEKRLQQIRDNLNYGMRNKKLTQEQIDKIKKREFTSQWKDRIKENARTNPNYGMKGKTFIMPEEGKRKIKEKLTGYKKTKKHLKHLVESRRKNGTYNDSDTTRKKKSKSHIGKKSSEETKHKLRLHRAKQTFPIRDTSIEKKIQGFLKELNIPFIPHHLINEIKHFYQCDLFVPSINLVIECDGNYWHNYPIGNEIDITRNKELWAKGFRVIRLWENEIKLMELNDLSNLLVKWKK